MRSEAESGIDYSVQGSLDSFDSSPLPTHPSAGQADDLLQDSSH